MLQDFVDFILRKLFRPLRIFTITFSCPLRADCHDNIRVSIITGHNEYTIEQILDIAFKTLSKHLYEKHNVNFFQGLEFVTENTKYIVMGSFKSDNKQMAGFSEIEKDLMRDKKVGAR